MSKIYEALKKSQEERERAKAASEEKHVLPPRRQDRSPPAPPPDEGRRPTARGGDDGGETIELPSLEGFPRRFWDAVLRVASAIEAAASGKSLSTIFVGAESGVGTTTLSLATSYQLTSDPGVEVLLIDAHARQDEGTLLPARKRGLIQLALGEATEGTTIVRCSRGGLSYLARGGGSYHGPKLFDRIRPLLASLVSRYDYVILDAAPVVVAPETAKLAALCDGAVVVLASERTLKAEALRAKHILDEHKVRIFGSVINRARRTSQLGFR